MSFCILSRVIFCFFLLEQATQFTGHAAVSKLSPHPYTRGLSFPVTDISTYFNPLFRHLSNGFSGFDSTGRPQWNILTSRRLVDFRTGAGVKLRKRGASVRPIEDQGSCAASWVFSSLSTIESALSLSFSLLNSSVPFLSKQQVLDCTTGSTCSDGNTCPSSKTCVNPQDDDQCTRDLCNAFESCSGRSDANLTSLCARGADPRDAFTYAATLRAADMADADVAGMNLATGIANGKHYPYVGENQWYAQCAIKGAYSVSYYESPSAYGWFDLLLILQSQPAVASVQSTYKTFIAYKEGIYRDANCLSDVPDHSIAVVGYDLTHKVPFWILRNSWGARWGAKGYMLMALSGGLGICGLHMYPPSYPVISGPTPCSAINPCGGGKCRAVFKNVSSTLNPFNTNNASYNSTPVYKTILTNACDCLKGFVSAVNIDQSETCVPADPCTFFPTNPCSIGTCVTNFLGSYWCICPIGSLPRIASSGVGTTCVLDASFTKQFSGHYVVQSAFETCYLIYTTFSLSLDQFVKANPQINCSLPLVVDTPIYIPTTNNGSYQGRALSYTINKGDSCKKIAGLFKLTVPELSKLNPGLRCKHLRPGQNICVKDGPSGDAYSCQQFYALKRGDTCLSIWRKFSLAPSQFFTFNMGIYCDNVAAQAKNPNDFSGISVCVKAVPWPVTCGSRYGVKRGDSCPLLLFKYFSGSARKLAKFNKGFICTPQKLYVGLQLCLPKKHNTY